MDGETPINAAGVPTAKKATCLTRFCAHLERSESLGLNVEGVEGAQWIERPSSGDTAMTGSKRFISGAVCPSCQVVDRIVIESLQRGEVSDELDEQKIRRRCVVCGFTEQLDAAAQVVSAPLPRARYDRSRRTTDQVEVVKILEPGPPRGSS